MQIVGADAEIEWPAEIRGQPELLAQLPGVFVGKILRDKPLAATKLRIAKDADRYAARAPRPWRARGARYAATNPIVANAPSAGIG